MTIKKWFFLMMVAFYNLEARYVVIKNSHQFEQEINKYEFVVACFISNPHGKDIDRQLKKDVGLLQEMVKSTSDGQPYKKLLKQEVGFFIVDMAKDSTALLVKEYDLDATDQAPIFLLFKNGKQVQTVSGQSAQIAGFIAKSDLLEFLDDYFGKDFDSILAKKAEAQEQERQMQIARYQAYAACRYPYRGWAPYNPWSSTYVYTGYAEFYPYGYSYNGYAFYIP